jgi:hypothetical protein
MKFATVSMGQLVKILVLGLALMLASSAFALSKGSLQLSNAVTLNGTTLKPGEYKVQWEGSGPNVEVSILQGKNVVATTTAHVVDLQSPSSSDAAVTLKNDSGPNSLSGLRFQGKKFALELTDAGHGMHADASSK